MGSTPGNRSRTALILLILLTAMLVSGCLRANVSMTISKDDLVSGQLKVSTQSSETQSAPQLRPPPDLADRVSVEPYRSGGTTGSLLSFKNLTFDEVERLGKALTGNTGRYQFHLKRSGSTVTLNGTADLTPLADTNSSVVIELGAPSQPTTTNGKESAGLIRWTPEPGEVTQLSATFQYARGTGGWVYWTLLMAAGVVVCVGLIGVLALRSHQQTRPPARAGTR